MSCHCRGTQRNKRYYVVLLDASSSMANMGYVYSAERMPQAKGDRDVKELTIGDYRFRGVVSSYDGYVAWDVLMDDSWEPIDDGMLEHVLDRLAKAEGLLRESRLTHRYCEESWYSCPKAEDGCANKSEGDDCNCGADEHNYRIDKYFEEQSP